VTHGSANSESAHAGMFVGARKDGHHGRALQAKLILLLLIGSTSNMVAQTAQAGTMLEPFAAANAATHGLVLREEASNPITVHVFKPKELEVWYQIKYEAENRGCDGFNIFQYAETGSGRSTQSYYEDYRPSTGQGEYTVQLPVDRFAPGRCGWHAVELNIHLFLPSVEPSTKNGIGWESEIMLGDWGTESEEIDDQCFYKFFESRGNKALIPVCNLARGQLQPHAIKASGSVLTLRYVVTETP
jgi:hypothetical protein